jgi:ribosomal protein S8E
VALERVPPYLIELVRRTDPQVLRQFVATGEGLAPGDGQRLSDLLGEWLADRDYWRDLARSQGEMNGEVVNTDQILDGELELLTDLLGDKTLAQTVLLQLPAQVKLQPVNPQQVQQNIIVIQQIVQVQVNPEEPASERLRVGRRFWRVFKGAAGGLAIGGDILMAIATVPTPTALVGIPAAAISISAGAVLVGEAAMPGLAQ